MISLQNGAFSLLLWNCQTQKFRFLHKKTVQSAQKSTLYRWLAEHQRFELWRRYKRPIAFPKCLLDFECDPFDLLGNAPYVNLQKSFPEKGEKSRREQQILSCRKCADFNDNTMENQEVFPKCRLDFESISLRPLRYVCLFSFYRTAPHSVWKNARFRCKITMKSWVRDTR